MALTGRQSVVRATERGGEITQGLFRRERVSGAPAGTIRNLFADLRQVGRGQLLAEHPERHLQGARLHVDRADGHGAWELYRLDEGLYVVTTDGVYDETRVETVPGEGYVEFHLRLSGQLEMSLPGASGLTTVRGPTLLMMFQPVGVDISERLPPRIRDASMTMYCRPQILFDLAQRNGIDCLPMLEDIERHSKSAVWFQQVELSPTLLYIATSLIESKYREGVRVLHAEAKALELLCEILTTAQDQCENSRLRVTSEREARQLENARRIISTKLSTPVRMPELARIAGMSESKLKRAFKARYGVTVFEYALERRMNHALELLRCKHEPVGQVAYAVGYRHQTSFASAFHEYFGILPSRARTDMN
jgi:AraC-like DNA-binding protein